MRRFLAVLGFLACAGTADAAMYETGVQPQTWNVFDVTWQDWKQFKIVIDNVDVWTSEQITDIDQGDNFYDVPNYQQEGAFSWQIQARHKNGAPLGGGVTGWGVIDSGTATEVASYDQYDAYVNLENTKGHNAVYTLTWWKSSDPDNPAFQHSSQFELAPGEKANVHLRELYPFSYRVTRQDPLFELDGSGVVPDPEVEDEGDSEVTEVETEPTETIHDIGTPSVPNPTPEADTERPNATADTTDKLDKNQDARAQDARNDAAMNANAQTGTTNAVNQMSKALQGALGSGQAGANVSEDASDKMQEAEDAMGPEGTGAGVFEKLELIGDDLMEIRDQWTFAVDTAAWPEIGWTWPAVLGGGEFLIDFSAHQDFIGYGRLGMLLVCAWQFVVLCLSTIKGIVS